MRWLVGRDAGHFRRIDAKRALKAHWSDPVMRAKLAEAYSGGDDEQAARILGVSLGSARLAKKRHLDAAKKRHSGPQAAIYLGGS